MIKLCYMVLKGVNWVHNDKNRSTVLKGVNWVHNDKIRSNGLLLCTQLTPFKPI